MDGSIRKISSLDFLKASWIGEVVVPECLPADHNILKTDLYLFFINSKTHEIVPLWSINYAYGHMYSGAGPVGEELPDFSFDITDYSFKTFTPLKKEKIKRQNLDIKDWAERTRIFPNGKKRAVR